MRMRAVGRGGSLGSEVRGFPDIVPIVSTVVPFFGLTHSIFRSLKGNPQKGTKMETFGTFELVSSLEPMKLLSGLVGKVF